MSVHVRLVDGVSCPGNFFSMWSNGFNVLKEILMDLGIAIAAVGAVILGVAAAPAAVVAAIVAAVATIVIVVHDNWETISQYFINAWNGIVNLFSPAAQWFSDNVIEPIVTFFQGWYD